MYTVPTIPTWPEMSTTSAGSCKTWATWTAPRRVTSGLWRYSSIFWAGITPRRKPYGTTWNCSGDRFLHHHDLAADFAGIAQLVRLHPKEGIDEAKVRGLCPRTIDLPSATLARDCASFALSAMILASFGLERRASARSSAKRQRNALMCRAPMCPRANFWLALAGTQEVAEAYRKYQVQSFIEIAFQEKIDHKSPPRN